MRLNPFHRTALEEIMRYNADGSQIFKQGSEDLGGIINIPHQNSLVLHNDAGIL